jgi:hypothetical protein
MVSKEALGRSPLLAMAFQKGQIQIYEGEMNTDKENLSSSGPIDKLVENFTKNGCSK